MSLNRPLPSSIAVTKIVTPTNPAAGAEISVASPVGKSWDLLAVRVTLVTAAAVANRRVAVFLDDGGANTYWKWTVGVDQAASLTRVYQFLRSVTNEVDRSAVNGELYEPLDDDLLLLQNWRLRTSTSAIQAADQLSVVLHVVEYG